MKTIYSKTSLELTAEFFDKDGVAKIPEAVTYSIINAADGTVIRTHTETPTSETYDFAVTVADNTLDPDVLEELRKVVIEWSHTSGTLGDVKEFNYKIIAQ
jgi:hypothetical protein